MYESPINVIIKQSAQQVAKTLDDMVECEMNRAIAEIGVKVDREELIKALRYDRDQYKKGYEEGKNELAMMLKEKLDGFVEELEGV